MKGDSYPHLGPTGRDRTVAIARAVAGMVPVVGAAIGELITEVVPGQRQARIEDWLRLLAERLATVEEAALPARLSEPENVALFEEGAYQAVRAFTEERRRQIAELVAGGIADTRRDYLESHRVLRLLGELDDAEAVLLAGYLSRNREGDYWKQHENVLYGPAVHLGSSRQDLDVAAVARPGSSTCSSWGSSNRSRVEPSKPPDSARWDACYSDGSGSQAGTTGKAGPLISAWGADTIPSLRAKTPGSDIYHFSRLGLEPVAVHRDKERESNMSARREYRGSQKTYLVQFLADFDRLLKVDSPLSREALWRLLCLRAMQRLQVRPHLWVFG